MFGHRLDSFNDILIPVALEHAEEPIRTLDLVALFGDHMPEITGGYQVAPDDLEAKVHRFPYRLFDGFSFDELCKVYFSGCIQRDIDPMFCRDRSYLYPDCPKGTPQTEIIRKLKSSMWRYGGGTCWNTLVAAYDAIRRFDFGEGFEVRLDWTTGYNERGYTCEHRMEGGPYLDGVFGFCIYHHDRHVLTIGFSISQTYQERHPPRLLVQQIQPARKKGNRWMYKLPRPYVEYALDRLFEAFEDFQILLVRGDDLAERIASSYSKDKQMDPEAKERVRYTYSRRLDGYHRRPTPVKIGNVRYHPLQPQPVAV